MNTSPTRTWPTGTRRLHLLDLENLLRDPDATAQDVIRFWEIYTGTAIPIGAADQILVATGIHLAKTAWFVLPAHRIQWRVRGGVDGADRVLLDACNLPHTADRFDELVTGTGDHAFTDLAIAARNLGLRTHQVIGRGRPSRTLMNACPTRTWLRVDTGSGLNAYREHHLGTSDTPVHRNARAA
jgi:hypothetical protein